MCHCQAKLQKLSPTYECKHETKNWKVLLRKTTSLKVVVSDTKIVSSSAWKWSVESVMPSDKLSAKKTIGDGCCTIVQLSSDAIVRWDSHHSHNHLSGHADREDADTARVDHWRHHSSFFQQLFVLSWRCALLQRFDSHWNLHVFTLRNPHPLHTTTHSTLLHQNSVLAVPLHLF